MNGIKLMLSCPAIWRSAVRALPALAILVVLPGQASSQSVLERVLGVVDAAANLAPVNGVYANIADNIPKTSVTIESQDKTEAPAGIKDAKASDILFYVDNDFFRFTDQAITFGQIDTPVSLAGWSSVTVGSDGTIQITDNDNWLDGWIIRDPSNTNNLFALQDQAGSGPTSTTVNFDDYRIFDNGTTRRITTEAAATAANYKAAGFDQVLKSVTTQGSLTIMVPSQIDGSIMNMVTGVTAATAEAVAATATATEFEMPALDFGDMATTALGR